MLPRRHIFDVCEFVKDKDALLPMCTVTLAIDAIKHLDPKYKKDHLVEALELNEFICYMYPNMRPNNRSLLLHVVSDLLGLLMYGVPIKARPSIHNLEIVNYSKENMEVYPVIEVWNMLKVKVYTKKHGPESIIEGFIQKIRIEMDIMEHHSFTEKIFINSKECLKTWLPVLSSYYDKTGKTIGKIYEEWWNLWLCGEKKEKVLQGMIDRLASQAANEYKMEIDKDQLFHSIMTEKEVNRNTNKQFSSWYKEGVNLLMKI
ncbi:MAG: hypothetical protein C0392_11065 [Syntrophus sp. (in: bacteria)]|nr:hypothetical protein [Syntrophus sp. (in: bacteria)]